MENDLVHVSDNIKKTTGVELICFTYGSRAVIARTRNGANVFVPQMNCALCMQSGVSNINLRYIDVREP